MIEIENLSLDECYQYLKPYQRNIIEQLVEKYGIEKIEGAKKTIGQVTYIENNKLYQKPVIYYNISDLKITKEMEQKFIPMKKKEKTQEIEKSRGQGIGD